MPVHVANPANIAATILTAGDLGTAYTLDFVDGMRLQLNGTLTANCVITIVNAYVGCSGLLVLTQDSTGGWQPTLSNGTTSTPLAMNPAPGIRVAFPISCPDSSTIFVDREQLMAPGWTLTA